MADFRDVMNARSEADAARSHVENYGGMIEDGRTSDAALAMCLAAQAVCAEIRALATLLDFARSDAR